MVGFQWLLSFESFFPWSLMGFLLLSASFSLLFSVMYASVRVEGKFLEVVGVVEAVFLSNCFLLAVSSDGSLLFLKGRTFMGENF